MELPASSGLIIERAISYVVKLQRAADHCSAYKMTLHRVAEGASTLPEEMAREVEPEAGTFRITSFL